MTIRQLIKLLQQLPEKFKDTPIYYPFHGEYDTSSIHIRSIDPVLEDGKLAFRVASHNGSTKQLVSVIEELHKRVADKRREAIKAVKRGFLKTTYTSRPKGPICYFDPAPYSCRQTRDPYEMVRKIIKNYSDTLAAKDKTKWVSVNLPDGPTTVKYYLSDVNVRYDISKVVKGKFKVRWTIHILKQPVEVSHASKERVDPATLYNLVDVYIFDSHYKIYPEHELISLTGCDDY